MSLLKYVIVYICKIKVLVGISIIYVNQKQLYYTIKLNQG